MIEDRKAPHGSGFALAVAASALWIAGVVGMAYFFGHVIK